MKGITTIQFPVHFKKINKSIDRRTWTSVAYKDVGKGREQERKLTPLRGEF